LFRQFADNVGVLATQLTLVSCAALAVGFAILTLRDGVAVESAGVSDGAHGFRRERRSATCAARAACLS